MTTDRISKQLHFAALSLAAFPFLLLLAFVAYVVEARIHLGHWPTYSNPDPKQLGWWIQHGLLQLGFVGFPVGALLAAGLAAVGRRRSKEFRFWTVIATAVAAVAVLVAVARIDPGGFANWFWD